jgi:D-lactate dehydrogenase (cytochrome)
MIATLFRAALPDMAVETDPAECAFYSADISGPAAQPAAVVLRPADADAVQRLVVVARQTGVALFPRGGGWSYTAGYRPEGSRSAIVDTSLLQSITIDAEAGTVEAGAGVTWLALYDALAAAGLRACSFGPLSGSGATVGGSAAQNGGFFGNAVHGALGDHTICGGTMVTGTGALYRLGPDDRVDGLDSPQPLAGDSGAFGIRVSVVLRTMPMPPVTGFASFDFPTGEAAITALAGLAGLPGIGEAYVFDPGTHANLARSGFSVIESAGLAGDLLKGKGGLLSRLGSLVRTARVGKAFVADLAWSLHVAFDGTQAEVDAAHAAVTTQAIAAGGEIIPDVIPRVTRARPFRRIKALLGPSGEAWLPLHGVFPVSGGLAALAAAQRELAASAEVMAAHGITSVLLATLLGQRMIVEPQIFWPDALGPAVRRMALPQQVSEYGARPDNGPARDAAHALRQRLTAALDSAGATHFQIGRSYAAHPGVSAATRDAWAALKRRFDPDRIINPGALGL